MSEAPRTGPDRQPAVEVLDHGVHEARRVRRSVPPQSDVGVLDDFESPELTAALLFGRGTFGALAD